MKRTTTPAIVLVAVAAAAAVSSCSSAHTAASPTTTTTTTVPVTSTTTSTVALTASTTLTTLPADQAFRTKVPGVLTVGTETLDSPWYIGGSADEVTQGFEYDLAKAIAARLGIPEVKVVPVNLVAMLAGEPNNADLVLNEVEVTDDRAKLVDLSEPYLTVGQAVLVRKGTVLSSVADGRMLRWGALLRDPAGVDIVTNRIHSTQPAAVLVDPDDGVRQVMNGELDAFVMDTPFAVSAAAANPNLTVAGQFRGSDQYAAVLPLGSPNTVFLNDVIGAAVDDGTVGRLLQRYFGMDPAAVPPIAG